MADLLRDPKQHPVPTSDPARRIQLSIRLSYEAARLIDALQRPGVLDPHGASKGDVIETAIMSLARERGVADRLDETKARFEAAMSSQQD